MSYKSSDSEEVGLDIFDIYGQNKYGWEDPTHWAMDTSAYEEWMLPLMMRYPSKVDWFNVCISSHKWMLPLMLANPGLLDWDTLYNWDDEAYPRIYEWMLPLFLENQDKINWYSFNLNLSEWMVPLIEIDPDQFWWGTMDFEPWMVVLLDKFPDHAYAMHMPELKSPKSTKRSQFSIDPVKSATAHKRA